MLSAVRVVLVITVAALALACGDAAVQAPAPQPPGVGTTTRGGGGVTTPAAIENAAELRDEASTVIPANLASQTPTASAPLASTAPAPSLSTLAVQSAAGEAPPMAPAGAVTGSPIFTRTVGNATLRFWSVFEARTGRDRFEYHFHVTVQNAGSTLLRGAVMVTSSSAASRVVVSCAPFGTTPPTTTRDADAPFVIAQDRSVPFDATKLGFSITATPNPALCDEPGRVTLRRLNRSEYDNTVRDLLGTTQKPALDFPADDFGYGFDTIGDVLALSPLLFEKAEAAARTLVDEALVAYTTPANQRYEAETANHECGGSAGNFWNLYSECGITTQINVEAASNYEIRVRAYQRAAGSENARMQIRIGGAAIGSSIEVAATSGAPGTYTRSTFLQPGVYTLRIEFINDFYDPPADRNLYLDWAELYGPLDASSPSPQIAALRALCTPAANGVVPCLRTRLESFVRRAWRRPPSVAEIDRLVALAQTAMSGGADFEGGLGAAMTATMTSPHFLVRVERDPHPRSAEIHPLSNYELATRLSYFLWASMPDAELDALANAGALDVPATLAAQIHRMVLDPKSRGFVDSFAGQWLGTRALDDVNPDYAFFPNWDEPLKQAMRD
jgi:hypothetical protein